MKKSVDNPSLHLPLLKIVIIQLYAIRLTIQTHQNLVDAAAKADADNVLEERDPQYNVMLSLMVGRIRSKPGGKLEIGEVCKLIFFL